MELSWISEVVECWYDYEVVCLTISREVRCGSGGRITARSSLVKAPVEIIPSVLSKTTQRLTVEVTVNWNGWRITDLRSWFKYSWNWLCTKFGRHKMREWVRRKRSNGTISQRRSIHYIQWCHFRTNWDQIRLRMWYLSFSRKNENRNQIKLLRISSDKKSFSTFPLYSPLPPYVARAIRILDQRWEG